MGLLFSLGTPVTDFEAKRVMVLFFHLTKATSLCLPGVQGCLSAAIAAADVAILKHGRWKRRQLLSTGHVQVGDDAFYHVIGQCRTAVLVLRGRYGLSTMLCTNHAVHQPCCVPTMMFNYMCVYRLPVTWYAVYQLPGVLFINHVVSYTDHGVCY